LLLNVGSGGGAAAAAPGGGAGAAAGGAAEETKEEEKEEGLWNQWHSDQNLTLGRKGGVGRRHGLRTVRLSAEYSLRSSCIWYHGAEGVYVIHAGQNITNDEHSWLARIRIQDCATNRGLATSQNTIGLYRELLLVY
jgi:hypothetical protein